MNTRIPKNVYSIQLRGHVIDTDRDYATAYIKADALARAEGSLVRVVKDHEVIDIVAPTPYDSTRP